MKNPIVLTINVQNSSITDMAVRICYSEEKNQVLQTQRGLSFERLILAIQDGGLVANTRHMSKKRQHQFVFIVRIENYVYAMPYVLNSEKKEVYLKTIYPSRFFTKKYIHKGTMKKTPFDPFEKLVLDKEEQEIEDAFEQGNFEHLPNFEQTKQMLEQAAARHLELQNSKPVTIRINQLDLIKLKARAKASNMPYQTLLGTVIHQFANKEIEVRL